MKLRALFLLLLVVPCFSASGTRERAVEEAKRAFPGCVVPLTESTDPHIAGCYRKWKQKAEEVQADSLADDVLRLRAELHNELINLNHQAADPHRILRSDTRAAIRKNMTWLRSRVSPWIDRLAQIQRGR